MQLSYAYNKLGIKVLHQGSANFAVKGRTVNIFGFAGQETKSGIQWRSPTNSSKEYLNVE